MVSRQLSVVVSAIEKVVERTVKKITLNVSANLIEATPVDTGWAAANWVPQIGLPRTVPVGTYEQAVAGNVSVAAQQLGLAQVAAYKLNQGVVFISNNVPYIETLNGGSSRQAPALFVQSAILRGVRQSV